MTDSPDIILLAIESSCDETSVAVLRNGQVCANIISSQLQHSEYGGVIPELASRLHQQQIVRVTEAALREAGIDKSQLSAVAFTRGPGLLGALLVGTCFAKAFAFGLGIPLIEINHMEAHVLANFLSDTPPTFPFMCLTVSGGHTQLVLVHSPLDLEIIGQTIDDAAGEAFDKAAKIMGLPYPGGPHVDRLARTGRTDAFSFPYPEVGRFSFSFSGIKTAMFYLLRDGIRENPDFIAQHLEDLCASYQHHIITLLLDKLSLAATTYKVRHLAIAGGVSANSSLRTRFAEMCAQKGWTGYIPDFVYCTDNAAMIGIAAHFKFLAGQFAPLTSSPFARAGS